MKPSQALSRSTQFMKTLSQYQCNMVLQLQRTDQPGSAFKFQKPGIHDWSMHSP